MLAVDLDREGRQLARLHSGDGHEPVYLRSRHDVECWLGYTVATSNQTFSGAALGCSITTAKRGSVVTWLITDWNGQGGYANAPLYVTTSAPPHFEGLAWYNGFFAFCPAYQAAPSAGSNSFGLTRPVHGRVAFQGTGLELELAPSGPSPGHGRHRLGCPHASLG